MIEYTHPHIVYYVGSISVFCVLHIRGDHFLCKNISSNQLISKNITFTKFLLKSMKIISFPIFQQKSTNKAEIGNLRNFLNLRFYVKSILVFPDVQKLPFCAFLDFRGLKFTNLEALKLQK